MESKLIITALSVIAFWLIMIYELNYWVYLRKKRNRVKSWGGFKPFDCLNCMCFWTTVILSVYFFYKNIFPAIELAGFVSLTYILSIVLKTLIESNK